MKANKLASLDGDISQIILEMHHNHRHHDKYLEIFYLYEWI